MFWRCGKFLAAARIRTPDCRSHSLAAVTTTLRRVLCREGLMNMKLIQAYQKAPHNIAEDLNIDLIKYNNIKK
jgi:hypothetical protein